MNVLTKTTCLETRHALSGDERRIEQSVLAAIGQHFAEFKGSLRQSYDAMIAQTPIANGVSLEAVDDAGVRGWWVRPAGVPADRAILYLHGGAYGLGSATAYRGLVSQIATRAGVMAFAADYPLAPEQPFPAAFDATLAAWLWLKTQGIKQIALVGDSAGGGLALAALSRPVADAPSVVSAALFSPWIDLSLVGSSFNDPETYDPIFKPAILAKAAATYLAGADSTDERASPLYAVPPGLPPLFIQVGTDELLFDDARRYAAAAAANGGEVRLDIFEGLHHVFQRSTIELPSARRALDDVAAFLSRHWARA